MVVGHPAPEVCPASKVLRVQHSLYFIFFSVQDLEVVVVGHPAPEVCPASIVLGVQHTLFFIFFSVQDLEVVVVGHPAPEVCPASIVLRVQRPCLRRGARPSQECQGHRACSSRVRTTCHRSILAPSSTWRSTHGESQTAWTSCWGT